jgi:hypothetical protein
MHLILQLGRGITDKKKNFLDIDIHKKTNTVEELLSDKRRKRMLPLSMSHNFPKHDKFVQASSILGIVINSTEILHICIE